jgi:hypothetical protein
MTSPQTFPFFEILPTEIRLGIWSIAAHNQRTLEVYIQHAIYLHCRNPIPALLHACRESRQEGLKYYSALYNPPQFVSAMAQSSPGWVTKTTPERIYISFERDILYFSRWNSIKTMYRFLRNFEQDRSLVKNLGYGKIMPKTVAFDLDQGKDVAPLRQSGINYLPVAETLIIVLPAGDEGGRWKDIRFAAPQTRNMSPLDISLLRVWEKLLGVNQLESFEAVGLKLVSFWEKTKPTTKIWGPIWDWFVRLEGVVGGLQDSKCNSDGEGRVIVLHNVFVSTQRKIAFSYYKIHW